MPDEGHHHQHHPTHHPLLETDPLQGVGPYGEAKVLAEQVCEAYRRKGLCLPILRPVISRVKMYRVWSPKMCRV